MISDDFVKSEAVRNTMNTALSHLQSVNAYTFFLEIAAAKSKLVPNDDPINAAALKAAWHSGYVEMLQDLFEFSTKFAPFVGKDIKSDFGAVEDLYRAGRINDSERAFLLGEDVEPDPTTAPAGRTLTG